jgi:transglutaminase-like putative cysteine protease
VTAAELSPAHWGRFAHDLRRGLGGLDGHWPYEGTAAVSRMAVLLGAAVALVGAAGLAFWPSVERAGERLVAALGLFLLLYTSAAVNEPLSGWAVQGVLLLGATWLWVTAVWPPQPPARAQRVGAWIAVASVAGFAAAAFLQSSQPLLDYHSWNPFAGNFPASSFNWDQQYGPLTLKHQNEAMFSVQSSTPRLWRVTTLDRFDGTGFVQSPPPPGSGTFDANLRGTSARARFTINGLHSAMLLTPGVATSVVLHGQAVPRLLPFSADGTVVIAGRTPASGDTYTVTAFVADSSPRVLSQAPATVPVALSAYTDIQLPDGDIVSVGRYPVPNRPERIIAAGPLVTLAPAAPELEAQLEVERSPYGDVLALARHLAAGARNNYELASRIESYLRDNYTYSLNPPRSTYPLVSFLLKTHIGYCQQFSGAMALMLRMDGIAARVVAGFQTGNRTASGDYTVAGRDAHEWVEAYFNGVGWVTFDPTPPQAASAAAIPAALTGDPDAIARGASGGFTTNATVLRRRDLGVRLAPASAHGGGAGFPWLTVLEVILAASAACALTFALAVHRRRGRDGVHELTDALTVVGFDLSPSTTLSELEPRLVIHYGAPAGAYAAALRRERYAPAGEARGPSGADRRRLRRHLGAHRGPWQRLRLLIALPPGGVPRPG